MTYGCLYCHKVKFEPNGVAPKLYLHNLLYDNSYVFQYLKINYLCRNFSHLKRL
ncbi:hypothetical protein SAMN06264346_105202 [Chryseobacterium profundimaris]|uniref:Uncharacterized protein n=1 Tax=Chryseobacterium profundimaris TaxID=1387275 RepID=A0ABY1NWI3_9FLAO|nr:hypothetical protein SAMN06264346_105202 [Chryseobacterium profundimaris]